MGVTLGVPLTMPYLPFHRKEVLLRASFHWSSSLCDSLSRIAYVFELAHKHVQVLKFNCFIKFLCGVAWATLVKIEHTDLDQPMHTTVFVICSHMLSYLINQIDLYLIDCFNSLDYFGTWSMSIIIFEIPFFESLNNF